MNDKQLNNTTLSCISNIELKTPCCFECSTVSYKHSKRPHRKDMRFSLLYYMIDNFLQCQSFGWGALQKTDR